MHVNAFRLVKVAFARSSDDRGRDGAVMPYFSLRIIFVPYVYVAFTGNVLHRYLDRVSKLKH